MSRIKINLASGNVIDKPLITCFKGTNGDYLVLDNETNGSMGLPIICISKLNGTSADKIVDQNEWAAVKDNLKTIIAGTALPYLPVPEVLNAQDDFFTQLTLPVASFDLLKNVYQPAVAAPVQEMVTAPAAPVVPDVPAAPPVVETPVIPNPSTIIASDPLATAPLPVTEPAMPEITPVTPNVPMPDMTAPVIPTPVNSAPAVTMPEMQAPVAPVAPVAPAMPEMTPTLPETPMAATVPEANDDIATIKENFMKSCENMFDALIKKFENK